MVVCMRREMVLFKRKTDSRRTSATRCDDIWEEGQQAWASARMTATSSWPNLDIPGTNGGRSAPNSLLPLWLPSRRYVTAWSARRLSPFSGPVFLVSALAAVFMYVF
jgi:hypothetical protein